ncbi:MAG: hypothetical protein GY761_08930 [Hyphomicrobiales bacterium]|nr:hypothetical protein [Hyphomicrobiales bacterium]
MVYRFFQDDQEMYSYETVRLDGDLYKVGPVDLTQDDGLEINPFSTYAGRAVDPTHLPTKVKVKGPKRNITDVYMGGGYLVDGKFKDVVEQLEPDVHQFFPVELFWSNDTSAGQRYWFFPCNRLDTVDRDKTTKLFRNLWYPRGGGEFVFSRNLIGKHHIWIDKFMVSTIGILMSNEMHDALVAAGITGMGFESFEETDDVP